ncbi:MAG: sialate O-acetylesterase [Dyadobacter sp.]|uniref:sialate O-acetylesterase n=1 Tax=Dyadobacter sp. TaxID=1914288 RepID=UPI0032638730
MVRILLYILLFVPFVGFANAQNASDTGLTLAPVYSDHMVLQRNKPVVIYGKAIGGGQVTVSFLNTTLVTNADGTGKWKAVFPASNQGGPYTISVSAKDKKIVLNDVLIGDVWLCSGQSNMDFQLKDAQTGAEELKKGDFNPNIRLLKFGGLVSTGNVSWDSAALARINRFHFFAESWKTLHTASAASFSAVAYYFGKKITSQENVPIGLIQVALGGSPTESWIDRAILGRDVQFAGMLKNWQNSEQVMEWCRERAAINVAHAKSEQNHPYKPGYNFQAGIAPLTDFPIAGVIWYQGESNVHNVKSHEQLFQMLVKNWREQWGYEFPFYYVQLSSIDRPNWPEFRDSQHQMLTKIPNSGMAVSYDLGDSSNVHPIRKKEIGERLAALALHDVYKKNILFNGPVAKRAVRKNGAIELEFSSGQKLLTKNESPLTGFELVNDAGERRATTAIIRKNKVIIAIPSGEKIKTVLYAYQPFTRANLYNEAGLPASTFSISVQ